MHRAARYPFDTVTVLPKHAIPRLAIVLVLLCAMLLPGAATAQPTSASFRKPISASTTTRSGLLPIARGCAHLRLPGSRTFKLDGFPVQIFQRIVMQLQPDGSVATLNLLDPGLLPYTGSTAARFRPPDPGVVSQTPPPTDPDYATKIIDFVQAYAPEHVRREPGQLRRDVQLDSDCRRRARCA